jgi:ADP-ribose pyrophosphatase YjhB (NUDIX family)
MILSDSMIESIHIAASAGGPMVSLQAVDVRAGVGLAGDRYAAWAGFWRDTRVSRDVTLIESETIADLAISYGIKLSPGATRRNLTTRGVRLNELAGTFFWIGDVLAKGTKLCEPCTHLVELTGKPLLQPLVHRGGLRADLLMDGTIHCGDPVLPVEEQPGVGVIVHREGKVLLGQRLSSHGRGTWSPPGGKPIPGESTEACGIRELEEETGLVASGAEVVGETVDGFPESRLVFRTRFITVEVVGEPHVREPDKTGIWSWYRWDEIPAPLFRPLASLVAAGYRPDRATRP